MAAGAKITTQCTLGDNISIGTNSVVNKSFVESNAMLAGAPARFIKGEQPWYVRDGSDYAMKVDRIEQLKIEMGL